MVVLTNIDFLYEPCIFWRYSFVSWLQWPDCMDISRWIVCIHFWGYVVCSGRWKTDITWTAVLPERAVYSAITKNWPKYRARVFYDFYLTEFEWNWKKKTMKMSQRCHFDRACRSVHVTRAYKQAPFAQLSYSYWAELQLVIATRFSKLLRQRCASGRNEPSCVKTVLTMGPGYWIQKC